jgi:hypothetical protein
VWSLAYLEAAKSSAVVLRMSSCSDVVIRARGVPASMPMPLPPSQPAALALVFQAHAVKTFHHLSASHFSTILHWHP